MGNDQPSRPPQLSRELSRGLPYMRTRGAYEEVLDAAEAYQALLGTLAVRHNDYLLILIDSQIF